MLEFKNVSMSYDSKKMVLENIDLKIEERDYCVIYGQSGCGKSTFLSIAAGLIKPINGSVIIDKNNILEMNKKEICKFRNLHIGYLPQSYSLLNSLTVLENVWFPYLIYNKNINKQLLYDNAKKLLEYVGMERYMDELPTNLSGGEKRRVEIARILINKPKYIIADEPTANLDNENVIKLLNILKKVNSDYASLIVSTHDDRFLNEANKILSIKEGKLSEI